MLERCARAGVPVAAALLVANLAYQHPCVIITGDSMRPALQPGDVCMVRRGASVAPGDAVLIRADWCGALVHRVVRVADARSVYTKGDASLSEDMRPVSRDEIVGPVVSVMPLGRLRARWHGVVAGDTLRNQSHSTSALTERRVPHYTALQGGLP